MPCKYYNGIKSTAIDFKGTMEIFLIICLMEWYLQSTLEPRRHSLKFIKDLTKSFYNSSIRNIKNNCGRVTIEDILINNQRAPKIK